MKNQKLEINKDIDNENEQMVLKIIGKLSPFIDILDSLYYYQGVWESKKEIKLLQN
jgi:hypothetical protein